MSMQQTKYDLHRLELQLKNSLFHNHDLCCGCNDPSKHLIKLLLKDYPQQQQKCLLFEDTTTTTGTDLVPTDTGDAFDALDVGDLEKLFENDTEDDTW